MKLFIEKHPDISRLTDHFNNIEDLARKHSIDLDEFCLEQKIPNVYDKPNSLIFKNSFAKRRSQIFQNSFEEDNSKNEYRINEMK